MTPPWRLVSFSQRARGPRKGDRLRIDEPGVIRWDEFGDSGVLPELQAHIASLLDS